ncbi:hypothetical protein [Ktedonobacter racemifer]|uniref:Restriction endonuclease type IV Mrr domain-containing protein n=1 Tax=Ktedonobacter racemifer DSM 44963 TaxID=485913 RepID=D6TKT0_KTERA|nr:hypothetical protein [Ktedonobacter racemifer]EFH86380.1 conserved hypothetical protein [Ktedonobacter racemifer DSM 44963]
MTENLNASGSATNAGIDYQQRVAAWLLVALLFGKDISRDFGGLNNNSPIKNVAFETNDSVDDLKAELNDKSVVYLQVKRSINLSTNVNSDFHKTMKQFIKQFVSHKHSKNYFVLATSSDTSSKVSKDLFKILESIRLNPHSAG